MILTPCSDLKTRETLWVGRKTETAPQTGNDLPIAVEASWIAGVYAEKFADDHVPVTFG
jgi:hypothetical protein